MLHALVAISVLLSLGDHWTTYLCLSQPAPGWAVTEGNPLAAWLFDRFGLLGGLAIDSVVTGMALGFLIATRRLGRPAKLVMLSVLIATTGYAVGNNLQALALLGRMPWAAI